MSSGHTIHNVFYYPEGPEGFQDAILTLFKEGHLVAHSQASTFALVCIKPPFYQSFLDIFKPSAFRLHHHQNVNEYINQNVKPSNFT